MDPKLLKKVSLFQNLSDGDLKVIAAAGETRMHHQGDTLFSQGDAATTLYVVHHGSVKIFQSDKRGAESTVTVLASGMVFGEIGLVTNETRSATGQVVESSQITHFPYEKLRRVLQSAPTTAAPFYLAVAKVLAQRLAETTTQFSFAKTKRRA